jgi:hypothetical protein
MKMSPLFNNNLETNVILQCKTRLLINLTGIRLRNRNGGKPARNRTENRRNEATHQKS